MMSDRNADDQRKAQGALGKRKNLWRIWERDQKLRGYIASAQTLGRDLKEYGVESRRKGKEKEERGEGESRQGTR